MVDVETTGIHGTDRIVTFAATFLERVALLEDSMSIKCLHLIFDPGKKCHPEAERVHGYDDWTLRHQEFFAEHAKRIRALLDETDLVVAHNAAFDLSFFRERI